MIKLIFLVFSSFLFALQLEVKSENFSLPFDLVEEMDYKIKGFVVSQKFWLLEIFKNSDNFFESDEYFKVLNETLKVKKILNYDPYLSNENISEILKEKKGNCVSFVSYLNNRLKEMGFLTKEVHGILISKERNSPFYLSNLMATPHRWIRVFFPKIGWLSFDPLSGDGRVSKFHLPLKDGTDIKVLKDLKIRVIKWD
jgi:hypothetical protein